MSTYVINVYLGVVRLLLFCIDNSNGCADAMLCAASQLSRVPGGAAGCCGRATSPSQVSQSCRELDVVDVRSFPPCQ